MVKQVELERTLLEKYNDKELVHYAAAGIKEILFRPFGDDGTSKEAEYAIRLNRILHYYKVLSGIDKRMNGENGINVVG